MFFVQKIFECDASTVTWKNYPFFVLFSSPILLILTPKNESFCCLDRIKNHHTSTKIKSLYKIFWTQNSASVFCFSFLKIKTTLVSTRLTTAVRILPIEIAEFWAQKCFRKGDFEKLWFKQQKISAPLLSWYQNRFDETVHVENRHSFWRPWWAGLTNPTTFSIPWCPFKSFLYNEFWSVQCNVK